MNNLIALNASKNSITGNIPTHICNSSPLFIMLELCFNHYGISGFGKLPVFDISGCTLFGKIPLWISEVAILEMFLSDNQLNGSIPAWIETLNTSSIEIYQTRTLQDKFQQH
jgi:hypothetical protein